MHELHSDIEFKYVRCAKMATLGSGSAGTTEIFRSRTPPQRTSSSTAANSVTSRRTITKPVEKSSNLVPGCVARVRSYPKIAALSVEATQSEAEAVAQEPASTEEAEEEEKSGMRCYFCASFS